MATASASAASSVAGFAFGSKTFTIMRTWPFSPRPAPTIDFFTRLGAYSATGKPASAGPRRRSAPPRPRAFSRAGPGRARAAGDVGQRIAGDLDPAPAGAAEAGIDAQDSNRACGHGPINKPG